LFKGDRILRRFTSIDGLINIFLYSVLLLSATEISQIQPSPFSDELQVVLRLTLALFYGGVIGWERQSEHKPAGLRTHMLVSLGAALLIVSSLQTDNTNDAANVNRVIQGIVTGIGFLGAGEILTKSRPVSGEVEIKGLTSAAAIWVSACLGIAAGLGLWFTGCVGIFFTLLVLRFLKRFE
jgi:putative Mg2+ transporter-C (MgtC) family protein